MILTTNQTLLVLAALIALTTVLGARDLWRSVGPRRAVRRARDADPSPRERQIYQRVRGDALRAAELESAAEDTRALKEDLILHGLDVAHPYLDRLDRTARELDGMAAHLRGGVDAYLTPAWFQSHVGPVQMPGGTLGGTPEQAEADGEEPGPAFEPAPTMELPVCRIGD